MYQLIRSVRGLWTLRDLRWPRDLRLKANEPPLWVARLKIMVASNNWNYRGVFLGNQKEKLWVSWVCQSIICDYFLILKVTVFGKRQIGKWRKGRKEPFVFSLKDQRQLWLICGYFFYSFVLHIVFLVYFVFPSQNRILLQKWKQYRKV